MGAKNQGVREIFQPFRTRIEFVFSTVRLGEVEFYFVDDVLRLRIHSSPRVDPVSHNLLSHMYGAKPLRPTHMASCTRDGLQSPHSVQTLWLRSTCRRHRHR